jgi:hypothetical protein
MFLGRVLVKLVENIIQVFSYSYLFSVYFCQLLREMLASSIVIMYLSIFSFQFLCILRLLCWVHTHLVLFCVLE